MITCCIWHSHRRMELPFPTSAEVWLWRACAFGPLGFGLAASVGAFLLGGKGGGLGEYTTAASTVLYMLCRVQVVRSPSRRRESHRCRNTQGLPGLLLTGGVLDHVQRQGCLFLCIGCAEAKASQEPICNIFDAKTYRDETPAPQEKSTLELPVRGEAQASERGGNRDHGGRGGGSGRALGPPSLLRNR